MNMATSTRFKEWWLPTTTIPPPSHPSLGLIIPLSAVLILLLVVGVCSLWHFISGQRSKRARRRYDMSRLNSSFLSNLQRSVNQTQITSSRSSSASVTPLRSIIEVEKLPPPEYVPGRLSKISESPEDRLEEDRLARRKKKRIVDDDVNDSILSMISKWRSGMDTCDAQHQSNLSHDVSQSYPSLAVPAQAPFSPYHLTWLTPDQTRSLHSEPSSMQHTELLPIAALAQQLNSLGSFSEDQRRHYSYSSWKSPYNPNHNTPVGSESDSCPAHFPLNHVPVVNIHHDLSKLPSPHAVLYRIPTEPSLVMSCPGNVEAYQANMSCDRCRIQQHEAYHENHLHSNHTSGDTSICPMMGSSGNNSAELMKPSQPYHSASGPIPTSQSTSLCGHADSRECSSHGPNNSGRTTESTVVASDQMNTLQGISSIERISSNSSYTEKDSSNDATDNSNHHHSAPAAYGNFSTRLPLSPSLAETQQLALEAFMLYNQVLSRSSATSHRMSDNPDVFSPGSACTDSSLPSISLSPFRVAALANLLDRSTFHSLPSETDVFLWDTSCDAPQEVPRVYSPPPPYTPPVLSDVKYWL